MKRSFQTIALLVIFLFAASAFAEGPVPITVDITAENPSNLIGTDTIMPDANFTLDFYFTQSSGENCQGFAITFEIYTPDSLDVISYRDLGGTLGVPDPVPSVLMLDGFEEGGEYWNIMNSLYCYSWDGNLPDSFHYLTIGIPLAGSGGWPFPTGEPTPEKHIQIGMISAMEGTFCVDSIDREIALYDWAWGAGQFPTFEGEDAGHCFVVNDPANAVDDDGVPIPNTWNLKQNYPNPFNPTTKIEYEVPYQSNVTLTVFNVLGQKIKTLVDKEMAAGFYEETWNGDTDNGGPAASGIYFYKIEGDNFTNTRKMMLLK
jgi:hypothetical protein